MMLTCSEYTTGYLSEKSNGIWCEHLIVRVVKRKGGKWNTYINEVNIDLVINTVTMQCNLSCILMTKVKG